MTFIRCLKTHHHNLFFLVLYVSHKTGGRFGIGITPTLHARSNLQQRHALRVLLLNICLATGKMLVATGSGGLAHYVF